jgi:hypothetical protein
MGAGSRPMSDRTEGLPRGPRATICRLVIGGWPFAEFDVEVNYMIGISSQDRRGASARELDLNAESPCGRAFPFPLL